MCPTAALSDGAVLQTGVNNHRDTVLAQLTNRERSKGRDFFLERLL
jgi:hypothetical protein